MKFRSKQKKALSIWSLALCLFITAGCQKTSKQVEADRARMEAMNTEAPLSIRFSEIFRRLPQTVVYAISGKLIFYTGRAEYIRTDSNLTVRIPLDNSSDDFIYAVKNARSPTQTDVYIVTLERAANIKDENFTGKKWWLDLQEGTYAAIEYQNNKAIAGITPRLVLDPGWEQCMIDAGAFQLDDNRDLSVPEDGSIPCPPVNPGSGGGFWRNIKEFFEGLMGDGADGDNGGKGGLGGGGFVFTGPMNSPVNNGPGLPSNTGMGGAVNWNPVFSGSNTSGALNVDVLDNNGVVNPSSDPVVTFVKNQLSLNAAQKDYITMHLARPKWNYVRNFLTGEITFAQLKVELGCQ